MLKRHESHVESERGISNPIKKAVEGAAVTANSAAVAGVSVASKSRLDSQVLSWGMAGSEEVANFAKRLLGHRLLLVGDSLTDNFFGVFQTMCEKKMLLR